MTSMKYEPLNTIEFEILLAQAQIGETAIVISRVQADQSLATRQGCFSSTLLTSACKPYHGKTIETMREMVQLLIKNGSNVNFNEEGGWTALYTACAFSNGEIDIAQILLDNGANPNTRTYEGFSPLNVSIYNGNIDLALLLLSKGANLMDIGFKNKNALELFDRCVRRHSNGDRRKELEAYLG